MLSSSPRPLDVRHLNSAPRATRLVFVAAVVVSAAGCTAHNPLDCFETTCTDPAFPFCDQDGALKGEPSTCIAVDCTPGDIAACRGDQVLRCNASGSDYDVAQCEHGCVSGLGCVACIENSQCSSATPTCDATAHTCRTCQTDEDCDSEVCDKTGVCLAPETVVYAAPDGSAAGDCGTQTTPCTFSRSFTQLSPTRNTIKLRPGEYTSQSTVALVIATGQSVFLDGPRTTLHKAFNDMAFRVTGPGLFRIKGLAFIPAKSPEGFTWGNDGIDCGENMAADDTHLEAEQLSFQGGDSHILVRTCVATLEQLTFIGEDNFAVNVARHGIATLDRCRFDSLQASNPGAPIQTVDVTTPVEAQVHVTNSVFAHMRDMHISQGTLDVQFSTFVDMANPVDCTFETTSGDHGTRIYSNSVFVNTTSGADVVRSSPCVYHYDLMSRQIADVANSDHLIVRTDPLLMDPSHGDYHLTAVSPVIDAADPAATVATDFDGNPRPEGPRRDLGAFEFKQP